jgi:hypothetical protein
LLSPGKALATPEELYLLVEVYCDTGHASEAMELLLTPKGSARSRIVHQDSQLRLTLLLKALQTSERWDDAFATCKKLLETPELASDDRIWRLLTLAQENTGPERF